MTRNLPTGERTVLEAFIRFEDEQKQKVLQEMGEAGVGCPYGVMSFL